MTRRTIGLLVTLTLAILVAPLAAEVQPARKMPRIGLLSFFDPPVAPDWQQHSPFLHALHELGWVEGRRSPSSGVMPRASLSDCAISPPSWCVSR
jgi:hypothetical protein